MTQNLNPNPRVPARGGDRWPRAAKVLGFDGAGQRCVPAPPSDSAFTLIEIMVVVVLLSIIILGLMAMFTQVQRAFRLGMNQTDQLEMGRVSTDLIRQDMEQMTPTYMGTNVTKGYLLPNFFVQLSDPANTSLQALPGTGVPPANINRTNLMDDVFFITRDNQTWTGIGYFVRTNGAVANSYGPVGSLYRYQTNVTVTMIRQNPAGVFYSGFAQALAGTQTGVSKILDGVVHFNVRAYDTNGVWITTLYPPANETNSNISVFASAIVPTEMGRYIFTSNAVPAFVDVELGVLEQQTLDQYNALPTALTKANFLAQQAGRVQLFRQRIPIRNVDPTAYQ